LGNGDSNLRKIKRLVPFWSQKEAPIGEILVSEKYSKPMAGIH